MFVEELCPQLNRRSRQNEKKQDLGQEVINKYALDLVATALMIYATGLNMDVFPPPEVMAILLGKPKSKTALSRWHPVISPSFIGYAAQHVLTSPLDELVTRAREKFEDAVSLIFGACLKNGILLSDIPTPDHRDFAIEKHDLLRYIVHDYYQWRFLVRVHRRQLFG